MGGIAKLAIEKGFQVTGSDLNCYPPMSTQLSDLGIKLHEGYDALQLKKELDTVVVGNALSRGSEVVEALLNSNQQFRSGPQWLNENILQDKWVIAVAGTHGKTTTASMIAWILEYTGYNPGFLIGGVMENFGTSARLTESPFFVVEADEYDTAFFDKRSKFLHYRARTCVLNNLEFDHADIFDNLQAIETQFHHLVRTVPQNGLLIRPLVSSAIDRVIERGCWTPVQSTSTAAKNAPDTEWYASKTKSDGSQFEVFYRGKSAGVVTWELIGEHNINNGLAAIAAAHHVGVSVEDAINGLAEFKNVKRRMELKACINNINVYDDFAHHPTAIKTTLDGLREKVGKSKIIAVVDPRSNTMKMGVHKGKLLAAVSAADHTIFHWPESISWDLDLSNNDCFSAEKSVDEIVKRLVLAAETGDNILIMSNGGFGGIHEKLLHHLNMKWRT